MSEKDLMLEFNATVRSYNEQCEYNGKKEGTEYIKHLVHNAELIQYFLRRYCKKEVSFDRYPMA